MGLDRLMKWITLGAGFLLLAAGGCGEQARPKRLLYGQAAAELRPVRSSVVTQTRILHAGYLARRLALCLGRSDRDAPASDALVVERIGVFAESLTFSDRARRHVYSCDGGVDPAGEWPRPWCGTSVGRLVDGRLLDPRLDILCRDAEGRPLAYAWVEPIAGAHWVGVDQGSYTELYEVAAHLPVRIATTRHVDREASRATFEVTQYDLNGRELVSSRLEAAVAG
jgi:hypothetical protein